MTSRAVKVALQRGFAKNAGGAGAELEASVSSSTLTGRQEHVRFVTPDNSGRNYAHRVLARQLQTTREANKIRRGRTASLQARDAARVERWRQRAAWKAEAAAGATSA
ncbi:hypothetical protein ACKKBG_A12275 [Auxenochlorella protothecoides x Auxenochlorella symbiontica]